MEKLKEKINKLRAKCKRLENRLNSKSKDDRSKHVSFMEKIAHHHRLKESLVNVRTSPTG
jgi:hypothetical protein